MLKVSKIWMIVALLFIGLSFGIVIGVVVDSDTVIHNTIKRIKQRRSPGGSITVEMETTKPPDKPKKEARIERREERRESRQTRRVINKAKRKKE